MYDNIARRGNEQSEPVYWLVTSHRVLCVVCVQAPILSHRVGALLHMSHMQKCFRQFDSHCSCTYFSFQSQLNIHRWIGNSLEHFDWDKWWCHSVYLLISETNCTCEHSERMLVIVIFPHLRLCVKRRKKQSIFLDTEQIDQQTICWCLLLAIQVYDACVGHQWVANFYKDSCD